MLAVSTLVTNAVNENDSGGCVASASSHSSRHISSSDLESLGSLELKFSQEQEDDFKQKFEGYNAYNPSYIQWLKLYHPDTQTALYPTFVSPNASPNTSDTLLREILQLPKPIAKSNRQPAINAKAACITETGVFSQLKAKEQRKVDLAKEKELKQLEREKNMITKQNEKEEKKHENQQEKRKERNIQKQAKERIRMIMIWRN